MWYTIEQYVLERGQTDAVKRFTEAYEILEKRPIKDLNSGGNHSPPQKKRSADRSDFQR